MGPVIVTVAGPVSAAMSADHGPLPFALMARTRMKVMVGNLPVRAMKDVLVLPVRRISPAATSYWMIAEPPSSAGAVQSTFTALWPTVTMRPVGAPGTSLWPRRRGGEQKDGRRREQRGDDRALRTPAGAATRTRGTQHTGETPRGARRSGGGVPAGVKRVQAMRSARWDAVSVHNRFSRAADEFRSRLPSPVRHDSPVRVPATAWYRVTDPSGSHCSSFRA